MTNPEQSEMEKQLAKMQLRSAPPDLRDQVLGRANNARPWWESVRWILQVPRPVQVGVATIWVLALLLRVWAGLSQDDSTSASSLASGERSPVEILLLATRLAERERFLEGELNP